MSAASLPGYAAQAMHWHVPVVPPAGVRTEKLKNTVAPSPSRTDSAWEAMRAAVCPADRGTGAGAVCTQGGRAHALAHTGRGGRELTT